MTKLKQLLEAAAVTTVNGKLIVKVDSENGADFVLLSALDVAKLKALFKAAEEYPKEANTILDKAVRLQPAGTVSTAGDGWGWYGDED